jgi:hypothetical protein
MARLSSAQRKALDPHDFAIPEKAPGSGSYPINDTAHVHAALMDCHNGEPGDCDRVESAVHHKYGIKVNRSAPPKSAKNAQPY